MTRIVHEGDFALPVPPAEALALFTPEGERRWVDGWAPVFCSPATDEPGAVWTTARTTWVTTDRTDSRVRYARVADDGTAGLVEVSCSPGPDGTTVRVRYDLSATDPAGDPVLARFTAGWPDLLTTWQHATTAALLPGR